MKKLWTRFAARIDALTLRERIVIFFAAAGIMVIVGYTLWIEPEFNRSKTLTADMTQRQAEMKAIQDQIAAFAKPRDAGPEAALRARLDRARRLQAELDATIAEAERKFTAPQKMRVVLEELLAKNPRIALVSLKTLPIVSIAEERAAAAAPGGATPAAPQSAAKPPAASAARLIFRHGIELTVSGTYLDVLKYLTDLERLPTQLYWSSLELESRFPSASIRIVVYTLSLDRAWLSV